MNPEIVVAIDFGTTRSAWAYQVDGQAGDKILVRIPQTALNSRSSPVKTETAALIGNRGEGNLLAFGSGALKMHAENESDDEALFRWFKFNLCESGAGQSHDSVMVESTSGHTVPLLGVMRASLAYFKEDVLNFLSATSGTTVDAEDVIWVLTVPAIYDDFCKDFMRRAAYEAGIIDNVGSTKLRLCLEPEAACLAVTAEGGDSPLTVEAEGKNIMIVDCGGGTIDVTTHHVLSVDPLRLDELAAPDGGLWGSSRVDNAFRAWFKTFLGDVFDQVEGTEALVSIMMTWESKKAEYQGLQSNQPLRLNLSDLAQNGVTLDDLKCLREEYNRGRGEEHRVEGRKFMVSLPTTLVATFFTRTLNNIAGCLRGIRQKASVRDLHRVYVVGGFSRCPLLQETVKTALGSDTCSVLQVHEPDIAIVRGAVMYYSKSATFNSRKAKLTYGYQAAEPFDTTNAAHQLSRLGGETHIGPDGKVMVTDVFQTLIRAGDDLPADGTLSTVKLSPWTLSVETMSVDIWTSSARGPRYVSERGCSKLAKILVNLDTSKATLDERSIRLELVFGGPEMIVRIKHRTKDVQIADATINLSRS